MNRLKFINKIIFIKNSFYNNNININNLLITTATKKYSSNKNLQIDTIESLNQNNNSNQEDKKIIKNEQKKIYLRDDKNRLLGLMTINEAEKLAKKHKKLLKKIDGESKKILTMKFFDPRFDDQKFDNDENLINNDVDDDVDNNDENVEMMIKKKPIQPKIITFTSTIGKHDLQIKINNVKKFILREQETMIKVTSIQTNDEIKFKLENIFNEFDRIFNEKNGCRINQKRLTDFDLKFNILISNIDIVKKKFGSTNDDNNDDSSTITKKSIPNVVIDPKQLLLEEDMTKILEKFNNDNNDNDNDNVEKK